MLETWVSDDCGKALNPLAVHGQTCGAAVDGDRLDAVRAAAIRQLPAAERQFRRLHDADGRLRFRRSIPASSNRTNPTALMAPKVRARPRWFRAQPRSRTRCTTRSACASRRCRSRRRKSCAGDCARCRARPMREFDYLEPASIAEASEMLAAHGDNCRMMAGGTALMLALRQRMVTPTHVISLARYP